LGIELGRPANRSIGSGNYFFDGELESAALDDQKIKYSLYCIGDQTNVVSAAVVTRILAIRPARLAVLLGMAAGRPGSDVRKGDVVLAESVIYGTPGTLTDTGVIINEPKVFRLSPAVAGEFSNAMPQHHGWFEMLGVLLERAESVESIALPPVEDRPRNPRLLRRPILSVEQVNETTSLADYMDMFHGDASALDMEAAGFAQACEDLRQPWLIFRGISDFGAEVADGSEAGLAQRPKDWQTAATLAAATAFRCWAEGQALMWQTTDLPL
jgi:nucleoside phosphorylase